MTKSSPLPLVYILNHLSILYRTPRRYIPGKKTSTFLTGPCVLLNNIPRQCLREGCSACPFLHHSAVLSRYNLYPLLTGEELRKVPVFRWFRRNPPEAPLCRYVGSSVLLKITKTKLIGSRLDRFYITPLAIFQRPRRDATALPLRAEALDLTPGEFLYMGGHKCRDEGRVLLGDVLDNY